MATDPGVVVTDRDGVRLVTVDRPAVKNALHTAAYDAITTALTEARARDDVSCVVLTGSGSDFTAGWDLAEAADPPPAVDDGREHGYPPFIEAVESFPKPLLAAVRGVAVGIGFTLLGHCDLVVFGRTARLKAPFVGLGLCPEAGATVTLPALLGRQLATELLLTGRWLQAEEAVAAGLGVAVVDDDDVLDHALDLAAALAAQPISSLRATKELLLASRLPAAQAARRLEDQTFAGLLGSPANVAAVEALTGGRR
ncbi:enoyl-CoA hydratase/isomerase family protein [Euzebya sp.]|uniref:enoyl-CoA hydratase/isomerase family protein n=1 Tax=Euzebya sp. TaxID=1971409 RepID=UPI0035146BC2